MNLYDVYAYIIIIRMNIFSYKNNDSALLRHLQAIK